MVNNITTASMLINQLVDCSSVITDLPMANVSILLLYPINQSVDCSSVMYILKIECQTAYKETNYINT